MIFIREKNEIYEILSYFTFLFIITAFAWLQTLPALLSFPLFSFNFVLILISVAIMVNRPSFEIISATLIGTLFLSYEPAISSQLLFLGLLVFLALFLRRFLVVDGFISSVLFTAFIFIAWHLVLASSSSLLLFPVIYDIIISSLLVGLLFILFNRFLNNSE